MKTKQEVKGKGGKLTPDEIEYIRKNCLTKPDEDIARELNRTLVTICRARKKLGVFKGPSGAIKSLDKNNYAMQLIGKKLSEKQKIEFFKTEMINSSFYANLKEQFTEREINFYLEEWGSLCYQFEDVLSTEKRQIDQYIKAFIISNRILRNIQVTETEIQKLTVELEKYRKKHDMSNDEEAQERDVQLMSLLQMMHGQSEAMGNSWQKSEDMKNKILSELNARRKDRVEQIGKRGSTFLGLVQQFRERETRETQGRHIELLKLAKEKKTQEWNKVMTFPDGTKDCILMNENAQLTKSQDIPIPDILIPYIEGKGKKILIVDDEPKRGIFFSSLFKKNDIRFASDADRAVVAMKDTEFDLICLDYDLSTGQNGKMLVDTVLAENLLPKADYFIHSENIQGAQTMFASLQDARSSDIYPFYQLQKTVQQNKENK